MIKGIGTDITDIRRIRAALNDAFIKRCFTVAEQDRALQIANGTQRVAHYAKRYAAKEACAKALGCGIGKHAGLLEIECLNNDKGAPIITLHGAALQTSDGGTVHISLSDEADYAIAYCVIEKK